MCLSTSLSSIHRVFISNLQKEIEKQTRHRSSRKRRSESQYDYEVYHSLEEVDVKLTIYPPICPSPLPSNLMHTQSKQTSFPQSCQTQNYPIPQPLSPPAPCSPTHALHHRHFTALQCLFSHLHQAPGSWNSQALSSSMNSTRASWELRQIWALILFLAVFTDLHAHEFMCAWADINKNLTNTWTEIYRACMTWYFQSLHCIWRPENEM